MLLLGPGAPAKSRGAPDLAGGWENHWAVSTLGSPRRCPSSRQRLWPEALASLPAPSRRGQGAETCDSGRRQTRSDLPASAPPLAGQRPRPPSALLRGSGPSRRRRTLVSGEGGRRRDPTVLRGPGPFFSLLLWLKQPLLFSSTPRSPSPPASPGLPVAEKGERAKR